MGVTDVELAAGLDEARHHLAPLGDVGQPVDRADAGVDAVELFGYVLWGVVQLGLDECCLDPNSFGE